MSYVIGTDTGGTFTDTVLINSDGTVTIGKRPSTPSDFVQGVVDSVRDAADAIGLTGEQLLADTDLFLHGTTVVVNAIVQGKGSKVGLITTKGFGDTVFIGRAVSRTAGQSSEELRAFAKIARPEPSIPVSKQLVREVEERVDANGNVLVPIRDSDIRTAIEQLVAQGAEALAVCLLWSFRTPAHEERIRDIALEIAPEVPVTLSSDIARRLGEYERTATAGVNASMVKVASDYLGRLGPTLESNGLANPLLIMQGNGGVATPESVAKHPVNLLGSGPAGGVLGAKMLADRMGIRDVICTDVGGTTFDVGLIVDGEPLSTPRAIVNQHTLYVPLVDTISIGAGGGSIASAENAYGIKRLRVGPESAGARPGPVCYNVGGTLPTVTDADLVLGLLDPEFFLNGKMQLDVEGAREAIRTHIAEPLGMSIDEAAAGILEVADNRMADLTRQITVQRGYDPRNFTAFLYGGGGPLHGTAYAAKLGLRSMVVPGGALASVFSAWGIASADIRHTFEREQTMRFPLDAADVNATYAELERAAHERLERDGVPRDQRVLTRSVEMRYAMQTNELGVAVPMQALTDETIDQIATEFDRGYERVYGKGSGYREAGIEATTFRVQAVGRVSNIDVRPAERGSVTPEPIGSRPVYWPEARERVSTPVYRGTDLGIDAALEGPALIELPTTTVALHPEQRLRVDDLQNYLITEGA